MDNNTVFDEKVYVWRIKPTIAIFEDKTLIFFKYCPSGEPSTDSELYALGYTLVAGNL